MGFQLSLSRGLENKQFSDHLFEEVTVRKQGDKLGTGKKTRKSYKRDVGNWSPLETRGKQCRMSLSWFYVRGKEAVAFIHTPLSLPGAVPTTVLLDSRGCLRQGPSLSMWLEDVLRLRVSHPCSMILYVCTEWQHPRRWIGLRQRFLSFNTEGKWYESVVHAS